MKIKHLLAALGLSLVSFGLSAQITLQVTDKAQKASGSDKHHKIRFDYVICDSSNKIVKLENLEFTMKPGETRQGSLTAPAGYHIDPVVHLQLRQKPGDDSKWYNSSVGIGTFYVTNGRINLVIEGSSRKGYELMVGSASSPKFTIDGSSGDEFRDAQNANKGQLSLGAKRANREASMKAAEARADAEKKAAEKKAADEKAAEEARKMADFNRIAPATGPIPSYLSALRLVVRDFTDKVSDGSQVRLRLDYILCDAASHERQRLATKEIVFNTGKKDAYTQDFSIPSGYVIENRQIHYEIRARYTVGGTHETAESGIFTVNNEKLDGVYVLKAYVKGLATRGKMSMYKDYSSSFVREEQMTSGAEFAQNIQKQINDAKAAKAAAAAEKAAAEKKVAEEKKAAEDAKKYGLPQIKVSVYDMASSDGPQSKHRVFLDYVICDMKTGAVKDVKRTTVLLNGDNDNKTVTLTAPDGCVIRDGIHAEISTRKGSGGASYVSKITGIFKYGSANTMNISLFGTTDSISIKSAGSAPFTKDAQSAEAFKTANLPK
ncbi:MAG: hypothetical protein K6E61_01155 [Bacteroidales bacterium]|nr:hypothetical protein [Bacteroidales bacterium]